MTRTLMALLVAATGTSAGAEPAKFGKEHLSPTMACVIGSYRYQGAAELAALGGTKESIATAIQGYRTPQESDESVQAAAEQAAEYASTHSRAETEEFAEQSFAACLKEKSIPIDLALAPLCWRGTQRLDFIITQRKAGVSKETMLERVAAVEAKEPARGQAFRGLVEKVYGWQDSLEMLSFRELLVCMKKR
jgi:hypothetical protein